MASDMPETHANRETPMPLTDKLQRIDGSELHDEESLVPFWLAAGREPVYPARDSDVLAILRAAEYAVVRSDVNDLAASRFLHLAVDAKGRLWSATDIRNAIGYFEMMRRWKSSPSKHDGKKSRCRLLHESGNPEPLAEAKRYTMRELLVLVDVAEPSTERPTIIELLRLKAELLGVIDR